MKRSVKIAVVGVGLFAIYNAFQKKNANPKVYVNNFVVGNFNAKTIPPFGIFISESQKNNKMLIRHELVHWKQYQKEGFLNFTRNYLKANSYFGYDANPYEVEARLLSGEKTQCIHNYTKCVRSGEALTVSNKSFLV